MADAPQPSLKPRQAGAGPRPTGPPARPSDASSHQALLDALHDVVSGPGGRARDWDRFRSLFHPGARLIQVNDHRTPSAVRAHVFTVEEYIAAARNSWEKQGLFEQTIADHTESYGRIVHVFRSYELRRARSDAKPFTRGINSFQLLDDGRRWWIMTIFWQQGDPANPIPEKYLKAKE